MKPHVICLMASGVDGRALDGGAMLLRYRIQNAAGKGS